MHIDFCRETKVEESKRPLVVFVTLTVCLVAAAIGVLNFTATTKVNVYAWDRKITVSTKENTVGNVLQAVNISLDSGDLVFPSLDTEVSDDLDITIERAKPVFIRWRGKLLPILAAERKVSKILQKANIRVDLDDVVYPALNEEISADRTIRVVKVTYGEARERQQIPYETTKRSDATLDAGLTRIFSQGAPGIVEVLYEVKYEDGIEVSRVEKSRAVIEGPVACVMLVGARHEVFRDGQNIRFERALEAASTAYCPCAKCCGSYASGRTSTGMRAAKGVISVDPRVIPLGTRLYVEGYGFAVAGDVGGAIRGNRVDVCFDTHEEAMAWGRRKVKVYILP